MKTLADTRSLIAIHNTSVAALPAIAGTVLSFIGSSRFKKLVDAVLEKQLVS